MRLAGWAGRSTNTPPIYAWGSCPLMRAVCSKLMMGATYLLAHRLPVSSQLTLAGAGVRRGGHCT